MLAAQNNSYTEIEEHDDNSPLSTSVSTPDSTHISPNSDQEAPNEIQELPAPLQGLKRADAWKQENDIDPKSFGAQTLDMAAMVSPDLSPELMALITQSAEEALNAALKRIENGEITIDSPESCGKLSFLFKEKGEKDYNVAIMQFDKKGLLIGSTTMSPAGSPFANEATKMATDHGYGQYINEDYRVIPVLGAGLCR